MVPEARYNASGNDTVGRIVFGPLNTADTGNYTVLVSNVASNQTQAFSLSVGEFISITCDGILYKPLHMMLVGSD